ncbi:MAG TPA: protease pro-enzyme activation domain-containing protein [Acidobacteriaceae bacterium]|nr:protease pro-enzyme activation domain-containing protein [Acidobacteriaceae bacterium]
MHTFHRLARLPAISSLFLLSCLSFAQSPAPRIRGPIEAAPSVTLAGSLDPHIRTADDLGPLPPDTRIAGVTLVFNRSAAQQADLDQLVAGQTNPASPLFHHWLTPDEFGARFSIAASDIAAAQTWLQSHGFTIDAVSRDRITFSGNAAQIQQAFGAELHRFRSTTANQSELHFAPAADLSLPPALAPVTAAVLHLSDFRPKPSVRPHPAYTTRSTQSHFLDPQDIGNMYDIWPLLGSDSLTDGQGLAIVGQSFVQTGYGSMVYVFDTYLSGDRQITPVLVPGSGVEAIFDGDLGESEIDLEYGNVFAGGANIFFVYTGSSANYSVFDALSYAITQNIAPVISISYSECETLLSPSDAQQYNALLDQATAQGQTIIAASGDSGATSCAAYSTSNGITAAQQEALAVGFPASSPYVTSVGGTQMAPATFAPGTNSYWSSASSSSDNIQSLIGYAPEIVWNESSPTLGIVASGGGSSSFFSRPAWQAGVPGIPAGSFRLIPDVALQASVANPGYIICSDDPYIAGPHNDCDNSLQFGNSYLLDGGTSFAAPIFAGALVALSGSKHAYGLGNINPVLYSLAAQPAIYSTAFHDITSGTTACGSGDGNCGTAGQSNYAAGIGYDLATGLGSVDFARLAAAWPPTPTASLIPTYISFSGSASSVNPGAPLALEMTVWPINPTPSSTLATGTLSVAIDGHVIASSLSLPTSSLNAGATVTDTVSSPTTGITHIVTAKYSGDATHAPATSTFVVTEGSTIATGTVTISADSLSLSGNSTGTTQLTITPSGGYNGMLTWSSNYSGGTEDMAICYVVKAPPVNGPTTGTINIGVGTACSSPSGSMAPSSVQRSSLRQANQPSRGAPAAATFFALLLFGMLPARRDRKFLPTLCTALLAAIVVTLIGCGSGTGGSGSGGGGSPTPQVYTITIMAKDSVNTTITASTNFTLTVQ